MLAVAVQNYSEAVEVAKGLVESGIQAIELCGGFGNKGLVMISEAVEGEAAMAAVGLNLHSI
ncbi:MAG TPA: DUF6506 family protein [Anaerovoracaceae bacterium]|nr:DUF6506 family protein [Anaerovoracaceae bacterium]